MLPDTGMVSGSTQKLEFSLSLKMKSKGACEMESPRALYNLKTKPNQTKKPQNQFHEM